MANYRLSCTGGKRCRAKGGGNNITDYYSRSHTFEAENDTKSVVKAEQLMKEQKVYGRRPPRTDRFFELVRIDVIEKTTPIPYPCKK